MKNKAKTPWNTSVGMKNFKRKLDQFNDLIQEMRDERISRESNPNIGGEHHAQRMAKLFADPENKPKDI